MKILISLLMIGLVAGCASSGKKRISEIEDVVSKSDGSNSHDLAVTNNGRIVSVKIQNIQEENEILRIRNEKLQRDLDFEIERARSFEMKYREIRILAGLPPTESKKVHTIDKNGSISKSTGRDYDDEINELRKRKIEMVTSQVVRPKVRNEESGEY